MNDRAVIGTCPACGYDDGPVALDTYSGAGGAGEGYARAGFHVCGIDNKLQPRYPHCFIRSDALEAIGRAVSGEWAVDLIHASPPCQRYSVMRHNWNARSDHPDLLPPTHALLARWGGSWVIENVPGAPMAPLIKLCGSSFGLGASGYQLRRHRWFLPSPGLWLLSLPCQHRGPVIGIYGDHGRDRRRKEGYGRYFTLDERRQAMGIDWAAGDELDQAIPPAYTEYIGHQLLADLSRSVV